MNVSDEFIAAVEKITKLVNKGDHEYGDCIICENEVCRNDVTHAADCPVKLVMDELARIRECVNPPKFL